MFFPFLAATASFGLIKLGALAVWVTVLSLALKAASIVIFAFTVFALSAWRRRRKLW